MTLGVASPRIRALLATLLLLASVPCPARAGGTPDMRDDSFQSPALSRFWGRPVSIHASVLLPESYGRDAHRRYPVIYVVPAFMGGYRMSYEAAEAWLSRMHGLDRDFIVVFLQGMVDVTGESIHQEFADSANDGPWGTALTTEFIPGTDQYFRTIAAPGGRFLFGHSSGGWSVMWLQVNYPDVFGGAWALSPDPVDFHDFFGPDLTRNPPQNFYHDDSGNEYGIDRSGNHDQATIRSYLKTQEWMKNQIDTYDDVFGPRGADGNPVPLFDRKTGAIDATVAAYWEEHYDIAHLLVQRWSDDGSKLNGKLHVYVGDRDTFHLDGAVRRLRDTLAKLGCNAEIEFAPGDNHWQIYNWHTDMITYAMGEMNSALSATATAP
jgi:S-formylglutathione hydrolase FrmB